MSQAGNSAKKKPILQRPGCLFGFLGTFIGFGGLMIIGLLVAGYTWSQINSEDFSFNEAQAPEIEEPAGELPGEENSAPAFEQESASSGEDDIFDIAGTYAGTTTLGEVWVGYWGGAVVSDEITIIIADDGTITGSLTSVWSMTTEPIAWGDPKQTCVTQMSITENGTLSGKLVDTAGKIEIFIDRSKEFKRSGCPSGDEVQKESGSVYADVQISGSTISGSSPEYFHFEATKR
ncbi:MAG: hypothetical protein GY755_18880 [Chloroflexi bacterium]|nr:hypothetical protein [Chloroflexota bacterium]